jgi:hypothetical protein
MAPTFRHGKDARILVNDYNMSQILNDATINTSVDKAETSVFGLAVKSYMVGLEEAVVTYSGLFDGYYSTAAFSKNRIHEVLQNLAGSSSPAANTVEMEGDVIGRRARLFSGVVSSFNLKTPQNDIVSVEVEQQVAGDMTAGEVLKDFTNAVTGASTYTVVDGTKASTGSWAVHAHVTGWVSTGAWTFKVQHSSAAGGAYTDLSTARVLNSANRYVRVTGTGLCKRYLKAVMTAKTGGNANIGIAYGRNY